MTHQNLLHKASETPRSGAAGSRNVSLRLGLPSSTLRLGWSALLFAGGVFIVFVGWLLMDLAVGRQRPDFWLRMAVSLVAVASGLSVFALARYSKIRPDRLLDFGLVFLVLGSACISMTEFWRIWPEWSDSILANYLGIPWECAWSIMFPLLAPNPFTHLM